MRLILCSLFALCCGSVTAAETATSIPHEYGIWTGTIAHQQVMVCLKDDTTLSLENRSAYFYLRHGKLIPLTEHAPGHNHWVEGDPQHPTGAWEIQATGWQITGSWSTPQKKGSQQIALSRFRPLSVLSDEGGDCSALQDYIDQRVFEEKVSTTVQKAADGTQYKLVSALNEAVSSFELLEDSPAAKRLNLRLDSSFRRNILSYYQCPVLDTDQTDSTQARQRTEERDFQSIIRIAFRDRNYISIAEFASGYCGGAHPFSDTTTRTWSLNNGEAVDLHTWIKPGSGPGALPDKLIKFIADKAIRQRYHPKGKYKPSPEDDCMDPIKDNRSYEFSLGKDGLVFTQAFYYAAHACQDDMLVTFKELAPFLSKKGKEAAAHM